jgi:hypothetical protein
VAASENLSGEWQGTYRYPRGAGPDTPFLAVIEDRNGALSGRIIEPNGIRPETAQATLAGRRFGMSVDFTKDYHGAGPEYATPVDYVGSISDDGRKIAGVWSLLEWDGTFEMFRDAVEEADVGARETAELAPEGGSRANLPRALRVTD